MPETVARWRVFQEPFVEKSAIENDGGGIEPMCVT